jgi:hypothetical protein
MKITPAPAFYNTGSLYRTRVNQSVSLIDSQKALFGTGSDASILYDGSNLVIKPDAVGSGVINLDGDTFVSNAHGVVIGHTAQETISIGDGGTDLVPEFQMLGTGQVDSALMLAAFSTTATAAGAPLIALVKGGHGTIGSHTIVTDGEELGNIIAYGDDGVDLESVAAQIQFESDGTPGAGDMPGRIILATTADGSQAATERLRIGANGAVTVVGTLYLYDRGGESISSDGTDLTLTSGDDILLTAADNVQVSNKLGVGTANGNTAFYFITKNTQDVSTSATTISEVTDMGVMCFVDGMSSYDRFADLLIYGYDSVTVVSSHTVRGSPAGRTYSVASQVVKLAMDSGTYDISVFHIVSPVPS